MQYTIACPCGVTARGDRRRQHRVVACPGCGKPTFVYPASPWDRPPSGSGLDWWRAWRWPAAAGAGCLTLVVGAFLVAWPYLDRGRPVAQHAVSDAAPLDELQESACRALAEGRYHAARATLTGAVLLRDRSPALLDPAGHRRLNQLHRQADLLARLSSHPVEEVVRRASLVRDPDEWEALFAEHRGRTILFDDSLARNRDGWPVLVGYEARVNDEPVRLALEDLEVLRELPLEPPARAFFGARLARVSREVGGGWVVRFEPESGVLLTDMPAALMALPVPVADLREVLDRQAGWVERLSVLRPAGP